MLHGKPAGLPCRIRSCLLRVFMGSPPTFVVPRSTCTLERIDWGICWTEATYQLIWTYPGYLEIVNLFDLSWLHETSRIWGLKPVEPPPLLFWPMLIMNVPVGLKVEQCLLSDTGVRTRSPVTQARPSPFLLVDIFCSAFLSSFFFFWGLWKHCEKFVRNIFVGRFLGSIISYRL